MIGSLAWIMAVAVAITASQPEKLRCPREANCMCGRSTTGDIEVFCNRDDSQVLRVEVKYGSYLRVFCTFQETKVSDFDKLEGFHVGPVDVVAFQSCPATKEIAQLTEKFNVTGVKTLSVSLSNLTNSLEKHYLNQFTNISQLLLRSSGIRKLPENFLEDLRNLTTLTLLDNELESLPLGLFDSVPKLTFLELGGNKINQLKPGIFKSLNKLKFLNLWGNSLENITRDVFSGLNSLESLDLHNNRLVSILPDAFSDLKNLRDISLLVNNISSLPKDLFSNTPRLESFRLFENYQRLSLPSGFLANLTKLEKVFLYGNNMSVIPGDLFHGSSSITEIRLERNALTDLPDTLFKDSKELQMLDISSNKLNKLPQNVFSSLSKLKVLNLANNHLTAISESVFKNLIKLEDLHLERNMLSYIHPQAFPSMNNEGCKIKRMYLAHNRLAFKEDNEIVIDAFGSQSSINSCTSLQELYLANNTISEIFADWRQVMLHLTKLDLSNNIITVIRSEDLQFLSEKLIVNLINNKITYVDMTYIEIHSESFKSSGKRNVKVLLQGNPIRCDCQSYNLLKYTEGGYSQKVYDFVNIPTANLTCSSPEEVSGVLVSKLKSQLVTCDLTNRTECPKPCACRGRTADGAFIIDCSGLGLLHPPEMLPWDVRWNYTELHLEGNHLRNLPDLMLPGYDKVGKIYAARNNISRLEVVNLSPRLKVLEVNANNLTLVAPDAVSFLLTNNSHLQKIRLDGNPWQCDCEARNLLNFLQIHFRQVDFFANITCRDGSLLSKLSADDLCPVSNTMVIALSTSVAAIGIILGAIAAMYYRYQHEVKVWLYAKHLCLWFVTEEELDKDKHYDAFISYSHKDEDFVVNHLVPGLESGPTPFKLCLHFRDWIAGEWITSQIARSVEDSRRTVVVLSPNFLDSVWGRMEFRAAHKQALSEGRARVILLIYGDLGPIDSLDPELKTYLSTNTYVKWGDPWFWNKLRYALPHPPQMINKTDVIRMPPRSQCNNAYDDKLDLMQPNTPSPTTPPADSILNPMMQTNTNVMSPSIMNGHTKLILETNSNVNGCVKSV